jgi:hypothetical protein
MKRTLLGLLAAASLAASAAAQTDQQPAPQTDQKAAVKTDQPTHEEKAQHWAEAAVDAQLKTMKASLGIKADQEADWDAFEQAVRDAGKARVLAVQKEQSGGMTPMARNLAKADRIAQGQANLTKIVDAAKPVYASLDPARKQKFVTLGRMLVPERGQFVKAMRRLR